MFIDRRKKKKKVSIKSSLHTEEISTVVISFCKKGESCLLLPLQRDLKGIPRTAAVDKTKSDYRTLLTKNLIVMKNYLTYSESILKE